MAFSAFITGIIAIVVLESWTAALAAALLMAMADLWMRTVLNGQIAGEAWARTMLLLVSGGATATTFDQLRQGLRASLERYRRVFECAATGFALTNQSGEIVQCNRRLCEMTGYQESELRGLRLTSLVHPDDQGSKSGLLEGLGNSIASSEVEVRLARKDGSAFLVRLTLSSFHPGGQLSGSIFVMVDDISELQIARQALRAQKDWLDLALSAGALGTWQIDLMHGVVTGSDKFWEILGLAPASRRLEDLASVVHPADWPKLAGAMKSASTGYYDLEIRARRPDGQIRWIVLRGFDEKRDENPLRVGVAADLTQRRQTTLLRAAARKLERLRLEERHRFSNLFPVVIALVNMIDVPDNSVSKFKEALIDRIRTLEATHLLLSRHSSADSTLHDIIAQELKAYVKTRAITIDGPSVTMSGGAAEGFAMILHELATNSVKYGALGDTQGSLDVKWAPSTENPASDIVFDWIESGRAKASNVFHHGFGSEIMGVGGAPLVGHSPKLEFSDHGLRYSLHLSRKEIGA